MALAEGSLNRSLRRRWSEHVYRTLHGRSRICVTDLVIPRRLRDDSEATVADRTEQPMARNMVRECGTEQA